jgi:hypothetical protein
MQRAVILVSLAFFLAAVLGACGSRGPLDDEIILVTDSGVVEASIDSAVPDSAVADSAPPVVDAGTGLIQCGTCVAQQCGTDVTTCITDPSCQSILTCVATTCFNLGGLGGGEGGGGGGGGGLNPSCLLGCTGGGGSGVGEALGIFQCITGSCGNECGGLLGGLGGLGGGGFPDPAPPSIHSDQERRAIFENAFSAWPQLYTPARE